MILSPEDVSNYVTRTGKAANFTRALVDYDTHVDCVLQLRLLQQIPEHKLCTLEKKMAPMKTSGAPTNSSSSTTNTDTEGRIQKSTYGGGAAVRRWEEHL